MLAGSAAWLGWLTVCPALGFPSLATAAMLNLVLVPREDPGFWLGWALLVIGLAFVALVYLALAARGRLRPSIASGAVYGALCWLVAGALVMPLLGQVGSPVAAGSAADPMRGSFMMLDLGLGAPIAALIAWLVFGAVLGATAGPEAVDPPSQGPADSSGSAKNSPSIRGVVTGGAILLVGLAVILVAIGRIVRAPVEPSAAGTRTLASANVPSLPKGTDFFSVIELSQPPGATLGPHVHTYSGAAYSLAGVATISFSNGTTARVAPGQAAFIVAGQAHAHRNGDDQVPSALLAILIMALAMAVCLIAVSRRRRAGFLVVPLVMLIGVGTLGILNPWSNDWLFISVRSTTGRGAEMPMASSARLFESPDVGPFENSPYTEKLDEITIVPSASSTNVESAGPAALVVLDGRVEVQSSSGSSVELGSHGATVLQPGAAAQLSSLGGQPAHVLELAINPASGS